METEKMHKLLQDFKEGKEAVRQAQKFIQKAVECYDSAGQQLVTAFKIFHSKNKAEDIITKAAKAIQERSLQDVCDSATAVRKIQTEEGTDKELIEKLSMMSTRLEVTKQVIKTNYMVIGKLSKIQSRPG